MIFRRSNHLSDEQLSLLLDGRLSEKDRRGAEMHLQACARCREAYEELRQTVALLRAAPRVAVPRAFTLSEADIGRVSARTLAPTWARWATALAGLALVLLLGLDLSSVLFAPLSAPPPRPVAEKAIVITREVAKQPQPKAVPEAEKALPPAGGREVEEKPAGPPVPAARASIPTTAVKESTVEALAVPVPEATPSLAAEESAPVPTPVSEPGTFSLLVRFRPWLRLAEAGLGALLIVLLILSRRARG